MGRVSGRYIVCCSLVASTLLCAADGSAAAPPGSAAQRGTIDLATALERALASSPRLSAAAAGPREAAARTVQAGLMPNPDLVLEMEDFGGSGSFDGVGESQATVAIEQTFELGGKRAARVQAARAAHAVVDRGYEAVRTDVIADTRRAFYDVLAAQQRDALADDAVSLAEELVAAAAARVRAGSSSRVERTRAEVELAGAAVERDKARRALGVARHRLAAAWGETEAQFDNAVGRLEPEPGALPPLETLQQRLAANSLLQRARDEITRRQARVDVERRGRIPNVTLGLGYRRLSGTDDNALVAGLRVPLPLFDRNQGAVLEAEHAVGGANAERDALAARLAVELTAAHASLRAAYEELRALDAEILPSSQLAFETVRDGYREGRFSYIELLDAERELLDARRQRVSAATEFRHAAVEVERLTGVPPDGREPGDIGSQEDKP